MSEQLTLKLDNVSKHTSHLPAQIAQHEIEDDCKEERETKFGDNKSVRLVVVSMWFHEFGFGFSNLAVRFSSLF